MEANGTAVQIANWTKRDSNRSLNDMIHLLILILFVLFFSQCMRGGQVEAQRVVVVVVAAIDWSGPLSTR